MVYSNTAFVMANKLKKYKWKAYKTERRTLYAIVTLSQTLIFSDSFIYLFILMEFK
jgi:hypothetical protein